MCISIVGKTSFLFAEVVVAIEEIDHDSSLWWCYPSTILYLLKIPFKNHHGMVSILQNTPFPFSTKNSSGCFGRG